MDFGRNIQLFYGGYIEGKKLHVHKRKSNFKWGYFMCSIANKLIQRSSENLNINSIHLKYCGRFRYAITFRKYPFVNTIDIFERFVVQKSVPRESWLYWMNVFYIFLCTHRPKESGYNGVENCFEALMFFIEVHCILSGAQFK